MSWHYLQGPEEESWEGNSLDGTPSALLNLLNIPEECSLLASGTDCCQGSQSGTMCEPSTVDRGKGKSMLSLAGSRAKTLAQRDREKGSTESEAGSGWKWPGSFVKYDLATSSWKTRQCSLLEGLDEFSETWPKWGSMRDGECLALTTLEPATKENASGFVPTPLANDWKGGAKSGRDSEFKHWLKRRHGGTYPNPRRVEEMMQWPIGWTELEPLATDKFREWQHSHGDC